MPDFFQRPADGRNFSVSVSVSVAVAKGTWGAGWTGTAAAPLPRVSAGRRARQAAGGAAQRESYPRDATFRRSRPGGD